MTISQLDEITESAERINDILYSHTHLTNQVLKINELLQDGHQHGQVTKHAYIITSLIDYDYDQQKFAADYRAVFGLPVPSKMHDTLQAFEIYIGLFRKLMATFYDGMLKTYHQSFVDICLPQAIRDIFGNKSSQHKDDD
jgi:hypothetical protein